MMVRFVSLLVLLCLSVSCKPKKPAPPQSKGAAVCDLPLVADALPFEPDEGRFAEVVREKGNWRAYIDGVDQGLLKSEGQYQDFAKRWRDQMEGDALRPRLLISADHDLEWQELITMVRGFVAAGVCDVHFNSRVLTEASGTPEVHAPFLDLRMVGGGDPRHVMLIMVAKNGEVFKMTSHGAEILESPLVNDSRPGLDAYVKEFSDKAQRAGSPARLELLMERGSSYQRMVDVIRSANQHNVHVMVTDDDARFGDISTNPPKIIPRPPTSTGPARTADHLLRDLGALTDIPQVDVPEVDFSEPDVKEVE